MTQIRHGSGGAIAFEESINPILPSSAVFVAHEAHHFGTSRRGGVLRFLVCVISAAFRPKALLIAESLCLRQQLLVLQRKHPQPLAQCGPAVLDLRPSMVCRLASPSNMRPRCTRGASRDGAMFYLIGEKPPCPSEYLRRAANARDCQPQSSRGHFTPRSGYRPTILSRASSHDEASSGLGSLGADCSADSTG